MTAQLQQTGIKQEIANYVRQNTRNRIVFCKTGIDGILYVNVGLFVAQLLQSGMSPLDACLQIFAHNIHEDDLIGRYIALQNVGILMEPELKIDLRNLLDTQSKNQCLIILSDAEISDDTLWWYSQNDDLGVSLKGLSYKQILQ